MVVLLDTCFLIDLAHQHEGAVRLLKQLKMESTPILVPSLAVAEFLDGSSRPSEHLKEIERAAEIIDLTREDVAEAAKIARSSRRKGRYPGWTDALIAGTAMARGGLPVVTRNGKHFPGCETRTY